MLKNSTLILCAFAALGLGACSSAKEQLGISRSAPDEFAVVKRAPLEIPADLSALPPPRPGAARPQEQSPQSTARATLFGASAPADGPSPGETALLQAAGAGQATPDIRGTLDRESFEEAEDNRPVVKRLLDWDGQAETSATVVDAQKEAERLKENMSKGKPATTGETPSVER